MDQIFKNSGFFMAKTPYFMDFAADSRTIHDNSWISTDFYENISKKSRLFKNMVHKNPVFFWTFKKNK